MINVYLLLRKRLWEKEREIEKKRKEEREKGERDREREREDREWERFYSRAMELFDFSV